MDAVILGLVGTWLGVIVSAFFAYRSQQAAKNVAKIEETRAAERKADLKKAHLKARLRIRKERAGATDLVVINDGPASSNVESVTMVGHVMEHLVGTLGPKTELAQPFSIGEFTSHRPPWVIRIVWTDGRDKPQVWEQRVTWG